ncbi:hypothetical protein AU210_013613 [Fusarium oxysporum f. sp. radicis-cucumerinum]|uniref:LysM domain-containing protein n=1 Tax=Fusarium oxysporum f. sp. radicis-cucumerinum TaxID=327505 RepID=A0A2H3GBW8_FUSOX|nr:hypothetical protein AU210_013613 [Fusarium oxysporum f. sp. radicis-cucumerinum]
MVFSVMFSLNSFTGIVAVLAIQGVQAVPHPTPITFRPFGNSTASPSTASPSTASLSTVPLSTVPLSTVSGGITSPSTTTPGTVYHNTSSHGTGSGKPIGIMDAKPNMPHDPNPDCRWWWDNDGSVACKDMAEFWGGFSQEDFLRWNPSLTSDCGNYITGRSYCVEGPKSPLTTASPTPTNPGNGIATPSPIQPGMVDNCNKFYEFKDGEGCADILSKNQISLADFVKWNTGVGSLCTTLWPNVWVCVGVVDSGSQPTTKPPTPTTTGNGIATPTPTQPGMVGNCNKFYEFKDGETCADILLKNKISLADFAKWNTGVGAQCRTLWPNVWVCVGVIGSDQPVESPTPTNPGNGITTPTPTQPGMVGNCNKFYEFKGGSESCADILSKNGVSLADFAKWNTGVGETCAYLWPNVWVCVGVVGGSQPEPSPTSPGNGIETPSPSQPGMVKNCDKFHKVTSGQTCAEIGVAYGVTAKRIQEWNSLPSNCAGMWSDSHVCVHTIGYQSTTNSQCASDGWEWGGNKYAVDDSIRDWCDGNSASDGSYGYAVGQIKNGCFNTPLGHHTIKFLGQNQFGYGASLSPALCEKILFDFVNACPRGGKAYYEGWYVEASVPQGRC